MFLMRQWRHSLTATVVAAVLLITSLSAREILDRRARPDAVLDPIAAELHTRGIDVVRGNTASILLGDRPRITRLVGMPTARPGGTSTNLPWMRDFVAGHTGAVAGIAMRGTGAEVPADAFLTVWSASPKEQRVFLSFTRADEQAARRAAEALNAKGYLTFLFLNDANLPRYDAATVGKLFAQSGHHFVLDTPNARKSVGVWLEARVAKVTAGREARYVPEPRPDVDGPQPMRNPTTGTGGGGGAGIGLDALINKYRGQREPVGELFKRMDKLPGGVMFGNPSMPCAPIRASVLGLEYRRGNAQGERLVLTVAGGPSIVAATDQELAIIGRFVDTSQPALVSLKLVGTQADRPDESLRSVELHPALVDTVLGERLIRADMLIWPILIEEATTFSGRRVSTNSAIDGLREIFFREAVGEARAERVLLTRNSASNINDVTAQSGFCAANGRATLTGAPGIDVLMTGTDGISAVRLPETSKRLYLEQTAVLRPLDIPAYDAAQRTFQLSGLMNYVKRTNPASWSVFVSSLPAVRREAPTSRLVCPRCDPDALVKWIAARLGTN